MEKQEFDSLVKGAFSEAEVNPSRRVWTNIELELERAESDRMKRKLLFYKLLAAASVVFGLCLGGAGIFIISERSELTTAVPNRPVNPATASEISTVAGTNKMNSTEGEGDRNYNQEQSKQTNNITAQAKLSEEESYATTSSSFNINGSHPLDKRAVSKEYINVNNAGKTGATGNKDSNVHDDKYNSLVVVSDAGTIISSERGKEIAFNRCKLPTLVWTGRRDAFIPKVKPNNLDLLLASIEIAEKDEQKKQKSASYENLWASTGISAGLFNTVNPSSGTAQSSLNLAYMNNVNSSAVNAEAAAPSSRLGRNEYYQSSETANTTLKNERKAPGMAYSVGVQVGGKVANRWIIQSGLNYITQSSDYTSSVVVEGSQRGTFSSATSSDFSKRSSNDIKYYATAPHKVNNSMQLISLPVQAGFIALNKSVGIQVNGGISTDLFLQNTITPLGGSNLDKVTEKGKESAYRSVNFSGLFGTEFSYRFSERYRVAVNPGLRYPFSSIYKSEVGLQSIPLTFDVGLKFRYIFN